MNDTKYKYTFDPYEYPSEIKSVVYLKGSWYEIGRQYGKTAKNAVERLIVFGLNTALTGYGNLGEARKPLQAQSDYIAAKAPELMEVYKGISAGSGRALEEVLFGFAFATPGMADSGYSSDDIEANRDGCSNIVAWGDATRNGKLIAGANTDAPPWFEHYYGPAIVVFPDGHNAFVGYDGFTGNCFMNDKGVAVTTAGGQGQGERGDYGVRLPYKAGELLSMAYSSTASEAKDFFIASGGPGQGENLQFSDESGVSFVVEHTAARDCVRVSGDFGEKDACYTIASNGYLCKEMQDSLYKGEKAWDDCLPRIWTEERVFLDNWGENTIETVNAALGCPRYYIPPDWEKWVEANQVKWHMNPFSEWDGKTGWSEENWDFGNGLGCWSPENMTQMFKCILRAVVVPEDRHMYIMVGASNRFMSFNPNATGNFCKIDLNPARGCETVDPCAINKNAQIEADNQLFKAAYDLSKAEAEECVQVEKEDYLNMAKEEYFAAVSLTCLANITEGDEQLDYLNQATTAFCKAQCYAKLAQNVVKIL